MMPLSDYGIYGMQHVYRDCDNPLKLCFRSQNRSPIQVLDDARDAVQALHVSSGTIFTGSVDGHVRIYDLRMGQLRSDYLGRACFAFL